jgi:hypothetical protein
MRGPEAIVKAITTYLKTAIPTLKAVNADWPNPSENLIFPSITIMSGDPKFVQQQNYVISKDTVPDPKTGKHKIRKCMGSYDFVLKAHLWADSKPKRQELYELFIAAMNPNFTVSGLRLQIPEYFNEWVTFDLQNHAWLDNQESVQRSERRIIIDILVNCRAIVETSDYLMKQIENTIDTPDSIANPTVVGGTKII